MTQQIRKELAGFLQQYGWQFRLGPENEIQSGWQGEHRAYPLNIVIGETWISFRVEPFLAVEIDWESWPEIASYILEINDGTNMVKISLDDQKRIVMGLDIFVEDLCFERLANILGIIGYYADLIYEDILNLLDQVGFSYCESLNILA